MRARARVSTCRTEEKEKETLQEPERIERESEFEVHGKRSSADVGKATPVYFLLEGVGNTNNHYLQLDLEDCYKDVTEKSTLSFLVRQTAVTVVRREAVSKSSFAESESAEKGSSDHRAKKREGIRNSLCVCRRTNASTSRSRNGRAGHLSRAAAPVQTAGNDCIDAGVEAAETAEESEGL